MYFNKIEAELWNADTADFKRFSQTGLKFRI